MSDLEMWKTDGLVFKVELKLTALDCQHVNFAFIYTPGF